MSKVINFNPELVPLENKNLIEASAGTGKTYSIGILVLRLLLEKNNLKNEFVKINEILMVTFTNYAVAELETRVRAFVRLAFKISNDLTIDDDETIKRIVKESIKNNGEKETQDLLKEAILLLDETSIMTIHSFCQRTLTEFAFDTDQIFGMQSLTEADYSILLTDAVNDFWRNHITILRSDILKVLIENNINRNYIKDVVKKALGGKSLLITEAFEDDFTEDNQRLFIENYLIEKEKCDRYEEELKNFILDNEDDILARKKQCDETKLLRKADSFIVKMNEFSKDNNGIVDRDKYQNFAKVYEDLVTIYENFETTRITVEKSLLIFLNKISQLAIQIISNKINSIKEKNNLLFFDDMIKRVQEKVINNPTLQSTIREKYKAVFIDEFQDTDKLQYEIFESVFNKDTALFYIGDPKQSIYGFRKADINTYFKAKSEGVDNILEMNTNFRSSAAIINALNCFFKPTKDFNTFLFEGDQKAIEYKLVNPPKDIKNDGLFINNEPVIPITITKQKNKDEVASAVAAFVIDLFSNDYFIVEKNKKRKVKPSDIGVIVRTKLEADKIKKTLTAYKIPAVTIDDEKIFNAPESKDILYILEAALEISKANINKALLSKLTGYTIQHILELNEEQVLAQFKSYQETWTTSGKGIYVMLMKFLADHNVRSQLLKKETANGDRIISNVLQLIELLHSTSVKKQLAPIELISWLKNGIEGKSNEGNEFEQRMESDEEAIKIITIHKSKGLEYKILIAPYLDLTSNLSNNITLAEYRNEEDKRYYFVEKNLITEEIEAWRSLQTEQENRRLFYVALTRAKYKCYVIQNNYHKESTLVSFLTALTNTEIDTIDLIEYKAIDSVPVGTYTFVDDKELFPIEFKKTSHFELLQSNWKKMSYSGLNPAHQYKVNFSTNYVTDEYDKFIFKELRKGAQTGNLLHYIFEHIDFTNTAYWKKLVTTAQKRVSNIQNDTQTDKLCEMLSHVLNASIATPSGNMVLSTVTNEERLNELEFDFPVKPFHTDALKSISDSSHPWDVKSLNELEGIMNGKMDLFFKWNDKFYILDWKSNYLGDTLEDYNNEKLLTAMSDNNYNLQYHIYTVALCKYLALKLPDGFDYEEHFGGVIYLFIRGIRAENNTGIFFHKPDKEKIAEIMELFER